MLNRYFIKYRLGNGEIYYARFNARNKNEAMRRMLAYKPNAEILLIKDLGKGV